MTVVVDTNVAAYHLLGTEPFREEASAFWQRVDAPIAPASWEAELANVIWLAARAEVFDAGEALLKLRLARGLDVEMVPVRSLWDGALARAVARNHPVYDTLFVELAAREAAPLVTFDQKLLELHPEVACRPGEA